jgi:hypothetical protein
MQTVVGNAVISLIHTGLQPGDARWFQTENRFNGLCHGSPESGRETVKTVWDITLSESPG